MLADQCSSDDGLLGAVPQRLHVLCGVAGHHEPPMRHREDESDKLLSAERNELPMHGTVRIHPTPLCQSWQLVFSCKLLGGVFAAVPQVLHVLCGVAEYDELPVRHNEDKINTALSGEVRWPIDTRSADDPHTKTNLLLQVRSRLHRCMQP